MTDAHKALFLVKCGAANGLGHLKRCSVLASAMTARGWSCDFGLSDIEASDFLAKNHAFHAWSPDADITFDEDTVVVLDAYGVSANQVKALHTRGRLLMVFDDLASDPVAADFVINHNIYGDQIDYSAYQARMIAGPRYTLIPRAMIAAGHVSDRDQTKIMVCFGSTDDGTWSAPVIEAIFSKRPDSRITLALSGLHEDTPALKQLERRFADSLTVMKNASMPDVFSANSLFVGAGGVMFIEALAAGLTPFICPIADNQRLSIKAAQAYGLGTCERYDADGLSELLRRHDHEPFIYSGPAIDGLGADRVIDHLEQALHEQA